MPVVVAVVVAAAMPACSSDRRSTYVQFSTQVSLPGVALAPGTYVLELADPLNDPAMVRVLSQDRSTMYFVGQTEIIKRAGVRPFRAIVFGEAVSGRPVPIVTWYPTGDASGRRFIYRPPASRSP